jgi:cytochrome P450
MIAPPRDPIAAVTHADPYPFYAELVASRPLYRDDTLGLWVAASAAAVTAVLISDLCHVRPPAEPVPKALLGSPAAEVFRHLVRMTDGTGHAHGKQAMSATLASIRGPWAADLSERRAGLLWDELELSGHPEPISELAFRLPVQVTASLLGVREEMLSQAALWGGDFARCLAPAAKAEQIERGKVAAGHLLELFRSLLAGRPSGQQEEGLLAVLAREAERVGAGGTDAVVANGIGLLFQVHDATAGLIGNTLVALASHRDLRSWLAADPDRLDADPGRLAAVVQEVLRFDPPVHNTRRFVVRAGVVAGQEMQPGDAILVLLAAANRDPAANPSPDRFDVARKDRRIFTFGAGAHACPGEALAATIAAAVVGEALRRGVDLEALAEKVSYYPSANVRIPILGTRRTPSASGAAASPR